MRPARIAIVVILAAAAAVTGSYLALSTRDQPATSATAAPPANPVATAATTSGDTADREPAVLADGRHPVYPKTVDPSRRTITFDLIQYFRGEEATREAAKDHQESPPPNDTYIRNVNPKLRTLPVAADAAISANQLAGSNQDVPVTLTRLADLTRKRSAVFWITVRDDEILRVAEQWAP